MRLSALIEDGKRKKLDSSLKNVAKEEERLYCVILPNHDKRFMIKIGYSNRNDCNGFRKTTQKM